MGSRFFASILWVLPRCSPACSGRAPLYAEVGAVHKDKHRPGFAYAFYVSGEWRACREAYLKRYPLCRRCAAKGLAEPATQVHHVIRLTRENITDPAVALNWDNLEPLCDACHKAEHKPKVRWRCDAMGHVEL